MDFRMKERRQCVRHELAINFPAMNIRTGKRCGYLLDITPEGFQLVSEAAFTVHDVVHVRVEGDFGRGYEHGVVLDGVCKWVGRDINRRLWRAGFQISDENVRETEIIIRLICLHGM